MMESIGYIWMFSAFMAIGGLFIADNGNERLGDAIFYTMMLLSMSSAIVLIIGCAVMALSK